MHEDYAASWHDECRCPRHGHGGERSWRCPVHGSRLGRWLARRAQRRQASEALPEPF